MTETGVFDTEDLTPERAAHEVKPGDWNTGDWQRPLWAQGWLPEALDDIPEGFRVVHLGDLHFGRKWLHARSDTGANLREQDLYDSARLLVEALKLDQPDLIVLAGDIFNSMDPGARTYAEVYALTLELKKIAPVLVVAGNHDHKRSSKLSPLIHLRDFFGCDLHLTQGHSDYGGIRFHTLPYIAIENAADGREDIRPFETTGRDVLIAHAYASGDNIPDLSRFDNVTIPESIIHDPRFDLIMLGHIHKHTRLHDNGKAYYCGPLQPLDFGEMDVRPGYFLHIIGDTETVTIDRPLPYRKFYNWEWSQGDLSPEELSRVVTSALTQMGEQGKLEGIIGKVTILKADPDLRQSALPLAWQTHFESFGGLYLKFDPKARDNADAGILETSYEEEGMPTNIAEAYYEHIRASGHPELIEPAKRILAPLMLKDE